MSNNNCAGTAWHHHFWPWVLLLLPLTSVAAGLSMLCLAMQQPVNIVVDDYYRQGLGINKQLQREANATNFGLSGQLTLDYENQQVSLVLDSTREFVRPQEIRLFVFHAAFSDQDKQIVLTRITEHMYVGALQHLDTAMFRILAETDDWRLSASARLTPTTLQVITLRSIL